MYSISHRGRLHTHDGYHVSGKSDCANLPFRDDSAVDGGGKFGSEMPIRTVASRDPMAAAAMQVGCGLGGSSWRIPPP